MAVTGTNDTVKTWTSTTNASISGPMSLRAIMFSAGAAATATLYDASSSALLFQFNTPGADTVVVNFDSCGYHFPDGIKLASISGTGARVALYT